MMVALAALVISLCALFVSVQEVRIMRKQQKVSMLPYLSVNRSYTGQGFGYFLKNSGTGLAIITSVEVFDSNQHFKNWMDITKTYLPDTLSLGYDIVRSTTIHDEVITPNEEVCLFQAPWCDATRIIESKSGDLNIRICYKSLLDDYWVLENDKRSEVENCVETNNIQFQ